MLSCRLSENSDESQIIKISQASKAAKKLDHMVIDATIGVLYTEKGRFWENKALTKAIKCLKPDQKYPYASYDGGLRFQNALEKWLFADTLSKLLESHFLKTLPSLGATSALSNLFYNYVDEAQFVVTTNLYWNVYEKMLKVQNSNIMTFVMFEKGQFNMEGFQDCCRECLKHQQKLIVLLNTPSHNPTGYSIKDEEMKAIIAFLNEQIVPVLLIIDVAYLDFSAPNYRVVFKHLASTKTHILTAVVFSGSKTLAAYGLRMGSVSLISRSQSILNNATSTLINLNRVRGGSPNKMALSAFVKLFEKASLSIKFQKNLTKARQCLKKRAYLLTSYLAQANIPYYHYDDGFFVCLKTSCAYSLYEKLKDDKIYTIPLKDGLRIAISSLSLKDVKRMVDGLVNCFKQ